MTGWVPSLGWVPGVRGGGGTHPPVSGVLWVRDVCAALDTFVTDKQVTGIGFEYLIDLEATEVAQP